MIGGRDRFRETILGVAFREHRLALKVGRLDEIAIDDPQPANARTGQSFGLRGSEGAAADDEDARR
jgi:hypothetical protein